MIIKMILNNPMISDPRVYKEARYYISKGNDVEILCWDRENEAPEIEIVDGIKLRRFHILANPGSGFKKQIVAYLKFRNECIKYLKGKEFDVLHCHDLDGAIVGLGVKTKAKKVFDMHEYYLTRGKLLNVVLGYFVQKAQTKFNYVIYLNDTQKADVKEKNISKLLFLPNFPERNLFYDIEKTPSNIIRVGYAGNIRTIKSFENLFQMANKYENVRVDLYGDGSTYKKLLPYQNEKIKLYGRYDYHDANNIYKNMDIVNCVYDNLKNDSYPIKLFESIVTKTPVIVDKHSIKCNIVSKYDIGFLVDVNDLDSYDSLFKELNDHPELIEEKKKNFENIKEKYTWEDVVVVLDQVTD